MPTRSSYSALALALGFVVAATDADAQDSASPPRLPSVVAPEPSVLLPRVGDYRRTTLHVDPVESAVALGDWPAPQPGDVVIGANGRGETWRPAARGRSSDLSGGYAYAEFDSAAAGVMLLEAPGVAAVWLNGEWCPGDPYGHGWFRPPVEVVAGRNRMLVHLASPAATPRLVRPDSRVSFVVEAATVPDAVVGQEQALFVSAPLVNASEQPLTGCELVVRLGGAEPVTRPLRRIDPLLVTPITIETPLPSKPLVRGESLKLQVEVRKSGEGRETLAEMSVELSVVGPDDRRTHTFVSEIDGSVQPYAVSPAKGDATRAGVLLSLHDAGQTHTERLSEHTTLEDAHVVAPFGRGRWAFDWEDWSRLDALEALEDFRDRQKVVGQPVDDSRVAVVGRGMGGHGALHMAALEPERFASVGIVDGWVEFPSQGSGRDSTTTASPIAEVLERQSLAYSPLKVIENLRPVGVSILNLGSNRVAPREGRLLRERLGSFHSDFSFREAQPGEDPNELLASQAKWLASRRRSADSDQIDIATPDVGLASGLAWATILAPQQPGSIARVELSRDLASREVRGDTQNVRRLRLDLDDFSGDEVVVIRLDGQSPVRFQPGRFGRTADLVRNDSSGRWRRVRGLRGRLAGRLKGPSRAGGFKSLFCCRPLLVYGSRGDDGQKSWAAAKARYDAHLFLYRGAGRLEVAPDTAWRQALRNRLDEPRSIVLYGNAATNGAWSLLRREDFFRRQTTVQVDRDKVLLGDRPESGEKLALIAVRPRGEAEAGIGILSGTDEAGMRLTTRLRYFWSGVSYPDVLLYGPAAISPGNAEPRYDDVRAAGYFDDDWDVESGAIVWRDAAI